MLCCEKHFWNLRINEETRGVVGSDSSQCSIRLEFELALPKLIAVYYAEQHNCLICF